MEKEGHEKERKYGLYKTNFEIAMKKWKAAQRELDILKAKKDAGDELSAEDMKKWFELRDLPPPPTTDPHTFEKYTKDEEALRLRGGKDPPVPGYEDDYEGSQLSRENCAGWWCKFSLRYQIVSHFVELESTINRLRIRVFRSQISSGKDKINLYAS